MILIAAIDKNKGMSFNGRRQSKDALLIEKLLSITAGKTIYVNEYTAKLFEDTSTLEVVREPLKETPKGEYCFIEDKAPGAYEGDIEGIVLFKWNRKYPGDLIFDIDVKKWKKISKEDFPGNSHEKLTVEVYGR